MEYYDLGGFESDFYKKHNLIIHRFNAKDRNELMKELKKRADYYVLCDASYQIRRMAVEKALVDCLANLELSRKQDHTHYRRSGMDHKLARFASETKVAVEINFNNVLKSDGMRRAVILGRMMQNIKLCLKYNTPIVLTTGAKNKWEVRSPEDLISFASVLGLEKKQAKNALNQVAQEMIKKKQARSKINV